MANAIKAPTDTSALFNDKSDLAKFFNFLHSWFATRRCMQECGEEFFSSARDTYVGFQYKIKSMI